MFYHGNARKNYSKFYQYAIQKNDNYRHTRSPYSFRFLCSLEAHYTLRKTHFVLAIIEYAFDYHVKYHNIHVSFTKLVTLNKEYQSNLCRLYIGNPACIRLVQIQHWDYKDVHVHKEHIPLLLQSLPPCYMIFHTLCNYQLKITVINQGIRDYVTFMVCIKCKTRPSKNITTHHLI